MDGNGEFGLRLFRRSIAEVDFTSDLYRSYMLRLRDQDTRIRSSTFSCEPFLVKSGKFVLIHFAVLVLAGCTL